MQKKQVSVRLSDAEMAKVDVLALARITRRVVPQSHRANGGAPSGNQRGRHSELP